MNFLTQDLRRVRPLLGTYVEIKLQGKAENAFLQRCITAGFEAIAEVDRLMSMHKSDSDLTRLNQAPAGEWLRLHPKTMAVLKAANAIFASSSGTFDIRCGAVRVKKGIHKRPHDMNVMASAPLEIQGTHARKTGPWILDLGGIAKGYAVDCAVRAVQRLTRSVKISGIVNAGGDLRTWGNAISVTTRILGHSQTCTRAFPVQQTALATSSGRRGPFSACFTPAEHIRMPARTVVHHTRTATVFAKHCVLADALTKVVLLAPAPIAKRCLAAHNARAIIFRSDGTLSKVMAA
jgi:FAD:protein FMN transferase